MQKADHLSEQVSYYRFWRNENVIEADLIELAESHYIEQCQSVEHILLLQDTTELNLESHRGRIKDKSGKALRKLFVMALMAAIQILQLRQARSGETIQKPSLVFSNKQSVL